MDTAALIIGLAAVTFYLLGYLQKKRITILAFNLSARILYIVQYLLLGAFSGAVLDVAGAFASILAGRKNTPLLKKLRIPVIIAANLAIIGLGLLVYKTPLDLLPIVAVLFHTGAFWLDDEKWVRRISLLGCPPWFIYNFSCGAYGSSVGDALSFLFILISIFRYDIKKHSHKGENV
jgi:hypothetical protein